LKNSREYIENIGPDGISKIWRSRSANQYNIREMYEDFQHDIEVCQPLWVEFVHEEHCFDKYYRRREKSEVFSIEFVLEGSMFFTQDDHEYRVMPGEVFLVHLDRDNEFYTGPEKHCHRLACSIKGRSLNSILQATGIYEKNVIKLRDSKTLERLMRDCLVTLKERHPGFRQSASVLAYQMLLELESNIVRSKRPELLVRAIEVMDNHLSQRLSLPELAEKIGSSRSSLNRLFQTHFQQSPIDFFIQLKMDSAKSMLSNTNMQIQEIAVRVGYENALYFSTEFRKRVGLSPHKYRKSIVPK